MENKITIKKQWASLLNRFKFTVHDGSQYVDSFETYEEALELKNKLIEAEKWNEEQSKQRKPILTVEGKELFEGDEVWGVSKSFHLNHYKVLFNTSIFDNLNSEYFLTMENAKKYIAENKKTISYKELEEYTNTCSYWQKLDGVSPKLIKQADLLNHFKPKQ